MSDFTKDWNVLKGNHKIILGPVLFSSGLHLSIEIPNIRMINIITLNASTIYNSLKWGKLLLSLSKTTNLN